MRFFRASLTSVVLGLGLAACGGGSSGGMGTLNLGVTDAPVDGAAKIVIAFTGVELQPAEGGRIYLDVAPEPNGDAKSIDLLALQNGLSAPLLAGVRLPAGHYNWMRLIIAPEGSYLEDKEGGQHVLRIPSGEESGLKLNNGFNVAVDATVNFTIDFDLRNSVHYHTTGSGEYMLRPTMRLVDNLQVGAISGAIHPSLTNDAGACGAGNTVYVFAGAGVTPDDVDGLAAEPITSAMAYLDAGTGACRYTAAFLPAGDYTVAFTANSVADDPAVDNPTVTFTGAATVPVAAGSTTTHDFMP